MDLSPRTLSLIVVATGAAIAIAGVTLLIGPLGLVAGGAAVTAYGLFGIDIESKP